jgi:hypothetical protein
VESGQPINQPVQPGSATSDLERADPRTVTAIVGGITNLVLQPDANKPVEAFPGDYVTRDEPRSGQKTEYN